MKSKPLKDRENEFSSSFFGCKTNTEAILWEACHHLGIAPPLRPLPFPAPLPRGVVLPPLPRVLRRLAWLGALLAAESKPRTCEDWILLHRIGFNFTPHTQTLVENLYEYTQHSTSDEMIISIARSKIAVHGSRQSIISLTVSFLPLIALVNRICSVHSS